MTSRRENRTEGRSKETEALDAQGAEWLMCRWPEPMLHGHVTRHPGPGTLVPVVRCKEQRNSRSQGCRGNKLRSEGSQIRNGSHKHPDITSHSSNLGLGGEGLREPPQREHLKARHPQWSKGSKA